MGILIGFLFCIFIIYFIVSILQNCERKSKPKPYYGNHHNKVPIKNEVSDLYEPSYSSFQFYLEHEDSIIQMFAEQVWCGEIEQIEETTPSGINTLQVSPCGGISSNKPAIEAGAINYTTQNETSYYRELLNREEWKKKRLEILNRDHYKCQWCQNIVKLSDLSDLGTLIDDFNMSNIIKSLFNKKDEIIASLNCFDNIEDNKLKFSTFIESENIYVHQIIKCIISYTLGNDKSLTYIVSNKKEYEQFVKFDYVLTEFYNYKHKEEIKKSNRITIEYAPETSTNDNYYMTHLFDYSSGNLYRSQCLITCNGFTIVFPLYNYQKVKDRFNYELEVHHLLYRNGFLPWEYDNKELITLCENCHNYCHNEHDIPIVC